MSSVASRRADDRRSPPILFDRARRLLERPEKCQQLCQLASGELDESIARCASLTVVAPNRLLEAVRCRVVHETIRVAQSPERLRPHLETGGLALDNPVAQAAHVVEQKIGIRMKVDAVERADRARSAPQC